MDVNLPGALVVNTMISAGVGGVSSVLSGGKFSTGAQAGAYGYLFNFMVHATYSLSTKKLTVTDTTTGESASALFKNATEKGEPLTPSEYDILQGTMKNGNSRYRLERIRDSIYGHDLDGTTGQVNIRLHGPGDSWGCLTACSAADWNSIQPLIKKTPFGYKTVRQYKDITGWIEGASGYANNYTRIHLGDWERLKWYGTLKVTK